MVYSRRNGYPIPYPATRLDRRPPISRKKNAAKAKVRDYTSHVLVCKGGDCKKRGSRELRKALKNELRATGLKREVRVDAVSCLGLCKHGPNAVVYPGGTWYLGLDEKDVPEVVARHLDNGAPVDRLAADRRVLKKPKRSIV